MEERLKYLEKEWSKLLDLSTNFQGLWYKQYSANKALNERIKQLEVDLIKARQCTIDDVVSNCYLNKN